MILPGYARAIASCREGAADAGSHPVLIRSATKPERRAVVGTAEEVVEKIVRHKRSAWWYLPLTFPNERGLSLCPGGKLMQESKRLATAFYPPAAKRLAGEVNVDEPDAVP